MAAVQDCARELELELLRVRRQAEAARLDARAAELELLLRRLMREDTGVPWEQATSVVHDRPEPPSDDCTAALAMPMNTAAAAPRSSKQTAGAAELPTACPPWSGRLQRLRARAEGTSVRPPEDASPADSSGSRFASATIVPGQDDWIPRKPPPTEAPITEPPAGRRSPQRGDPEPRPVKRDSLVATPRKRPAPTPARSSAAELAASMATSSALPMFAEAADASKVKTKRTRPASWLISMLAHLVILLMLGFMTLASATPKDQVALLASASETSAEAIETFTIESAQPNEAEPTMAEPVYETSAVGSMVINDVPLDISAVTAVMTSSERMEGSLSSSDRRMLESISKDSESKMQFCGVDGGGNHFVYLVDSSGSMRDGFYSARTELLASIDQLQPDQRFYVVFFDEEPEYMRIHDPNVDEPASVMATPENKQRLRKWAMKVQMNPGKAPYEVLPFALHLRPDVIFLLSDGEFPSRIEDILRAQNHQDNLFGESRPICIVHTIRYHGVEGETGRKAEATMVKIAKENGGQYRHVPKPK